MIRREDFVFTIGYDGNIAVVDGALKKRYASLSTAELARQGLYKQAVCSAVYGGGEEGARQLAEVLSIYNEESEHPVSSVEELKRTFGVFEVPPGIGKVRLL